MAAQGTTIPSDSAAPRIIPSVPRPDQLDTSVAGGLNAPDQAAAADNATDMPRRHIDQGATGEVITATGDQLPAGVESKRLGEGGNDLAKGSTRYDRHTRNKESELESKAGEGAGIDEVPGEEEIEGDTRGEKGL